MTKPPTPRSLAWSVALVLLLGALGVAVPAPAADAAAPCLRDGRQLSPLDCTKVLVTAPYHLDFTGDAGGLADAKGVGTGFTMVDPPFTGTGYLPADLAVSTAAPGTLAVTTTKGIAWKGENLQQNALGVGIRAGRQMALKTTVLKPPKGVGSYEQAGLWWGNDQDNYVKLVVRSVPSSTGVTADLQLAMELNGAESRSVLTPALGNLDTRSVALRLLTDPTTGTVTGSYALDGGASVNVGSVKPPAGLFSADAAGIDPTIGTNTFGGILATHRSAPTARQYTFDDFSLDDVSPPPVEPPPGGPAFTRVPLSTAISNPSAMAFGPDGRLYVAELLGRIHALTLGPDQTVTDDQLISDLGTRLTLGLTIDPSSTATRVVLWAAHSDPTLDGPDPVTGVGGAAANSSAVARITVDPVARTSTRTVPDPITGLPRSQANHSINGLAFGPVQADGRRRLYLDLGGNTGAGAPNTSTEYLGEFGLREEQPLSAAVLEADVLAPGFDGTCANTTDLYGAPPCSVVTYATGLRNSYSLVWHSNGSLYAPDNGTAVGPSYPRSPTAPCDGVAPYPQNSPGTQDDLLYRVVKGAYYGHPDPHRLPAPECVFKNGSFQKVPALPSYTLPLADLGANKSADGLIEYRSDAFGGVMKGNLLLTNYSLGDDITRIELSADGTSVVRRTTLATGFLDPLPLVEGAGGVVYVGEFSGGRVTALVPSTATPPSTIGTWTTKAKLPVADLDAGGAALGGKLYVVAGKTSAGYQRTLRIYDPATNAWTTGPSLPTGYAAVENPAVVGYNGKLYVFSGSTAPFSGTVTSTAVYDPAAGTWSLLAPIPVGRTGAAAQVLGGRIYVVGGTGSNGASLASVDVYNPATNTWAAGPPMTTRRDNPGSASLGGKLYVFGGRTRNADGSTPNPGLASVEALDPATGTWTARAAMPTGRRTMVVGTLAGRAQLSGGDAYPLSSNTYAAHEEYDPVTDTWRTLRPIPTPRQGAVAGTIDSSTYVVGGGPTSGTTYSSVVEAFAF